MFLNAVSFTTKVENIAHFLFSFSIFSIEFPIFADKECENVCMRAEDLMQISAGQEQYGDLAAALVHCQHAIGTFLNKQANSCETTH